jgi:integrase
MDPGLTVQAKDDKGKPVNDEDGNVAMVPKYPGLHALRHFYASWCINRERDGGLGHDGKTVEERMGHSDISVTLNT